MKIKPRLGGGKSGDPSLYIELLDRKRSLLFDCGLNYFKHALLRKISDVCVSHTHIDHFIGFDTLLRLNLTEEKTLQIFGPPGILQNVIGKLQGYTWNICQNLRLIILVQEILPDRIIMTELASWKGFAITNVVERPHSSQLLKDEEFSINYLELNHKIPSFAYSFIEDESCNVRKEALAQLGLEPGPWVAKLKSLALDSAAGHKELHIQDQAYTVEFLAQHLLIHKRGVKITYLTDFLLENQRMEDIARFAWQSDWLFCEASFSEQERDKAKTTHHLTAKDAGKIARLAQVKQLVLFHFSRRYQDYSILLEEARQEFPRVE
ncbi:hypothetical protein U14_04187 [Candidatus Moduliflexus flocculans]|uniref:Uncharacterized protein n=1 Tax=Candidatus Moduliflexus flocculans TaxID=1499966 RepID=A0A0S6W069_9BACT|nr:hypothetical protein U14_04187 [Candidatus Moduliflexus flocculans]